MQASRSALSTGGYIKPNPGEVSDAAIRMYPPYRVQADAMSWADERFAINKVRPEWAKPNCDRSERDDRAHNAAQRLNGRRAKPQLGLLVHRLPNEGLEQFRVREDEARKRQNKADRESKIRKREEAQALALATPAGRLTTGSTFELWMPLNECWEQLRVIDVNEQQSARRNMTSVPLYTLESLSTPGKLYDRYDFSSFPGAEGAYRVRSVKRAPPTAAEVAATMRELAESARAAAHQTRAMARLGVTELLAIA